MTVRILLFLAFLSFSNSFSQQAYGIQRGQRGYIPPPKYEASAYITTIDSYEELNKTLPLCVEVFSLDDFEKEILKSILLEKYESYNKIVEKTDSSKQARQESLKELEINFVKSLSIILSPDEITSFVDMDFSQKKEKKTKRNNKRKNKRNNKNDQ